jgi:hypothetical protein
VLLEKAKAMLTEGERSSVVWAVITHALGLGALTTVPDEPWLLSWVSGIGGPGVPWLLGVTLDGLLLLLSEPERISSVLMPGRDGQVASTHHFFHGCSVCWGCWGCWTLEDMLKSW